MEIIADKDGVAVEGNDGRPPTKDWGIGRVAHMNLKMGDAVVGDERQLVRKHMVCSIRIYHRSII